MTIMIAFLCGTVVAGLGSAALRRRRLPFGRHLGPARSTGTPSSATPDVEDWRPAESEQTRRWRDRCIQLQLSEQYVTAQTRQIIDEYSALMSMALTTATEQAGQLRGSTASALGTSEAAQATTRSVVAKASEAEQLLLRLADSLVKVETMAGFIASVAKKTNLLSLNATIEAARAGAAGRGFGVVAQEVKDLATATATSTTDISAMVDELRAEASDVMSALRDMLTGIHQMDDAASGVAEVMTQQQGSLSDLEMQVNDATSQMDLLSMLIHNVDRRRHPRIAADGNVTIRRGELTTAASLLDLSAGGMRCSILRSVPLKVDDHVDVSIPTLDRTITMAAIIRRRNPAQGRDHLGLEFLNASEQDGSAIVRYLAQIAEPSADDDRNDPDPLALTGSEIPA